MFGWLCFVIVLALLPARGFAADEMTIVYGTTEKVTDLDPASAYDFHTWELFYNIYQGLLTYPPGETELAPGLAESYTISPDGKEYTFSLRKTLKFADGTPFNAEVVKWSLERVMQLQQKPSWLVTAFVEKVAVVDQFTVKMVLKNPVAYFPALVATAPYYPVNPKLYPADRLIHDPADLEGGQLDGLGPYKMASFQRDAEVVLEARPEFYGEEPKNTRVIIRYFAEAAAMRRALEKGEIDLAFKTFNPADITELEKSKALVSVKTQGPYIRYLSFLCGAAPFNNKALRQAVAAALDRPAIIKKVFLGQNEPLYSMIPQGMWAHTEAFKAAYSDGDAKKAKELLTAQGYTKQKPFEFDLWYTPSHYGDTEKALATLVKAQLEATGLLKVNLKSAEWEAYRENWSKKAMSAFFLGWYPDYIDPDNYTDAFAGTEGSKSNGTFFSDPAWDAKLLAAKTVTDFAKRTLLYEDLQKMWTEEVMTVPLLQGNIYLFMQQNIAGVLIAPTMQFNYGPIERK